MYAIKVITLILLSSFASCATRVVSFDDLVEEEGRFYDAGTESLFSGPSQQFHTNGRLMSAGYFEEGRRHGHWYYYAQDGFLVESGDYTHGVRDGRWHGVDKTRQIRTSTLYKAGVRKELFEIDANDGDWCLKFDKEDYKQLESIVIRKLFRPTKTSFYANGQTKSKGSFLHGEKVGLWHAYREDGQLEATKCFYKGRVIGFSGCA